VDRLFDTQGVAMGGGLGHQQGGALLFHDESQMMGVGGGGGGDMMMHVGGGWAGEGLGGGLAGGGGGGGGGAMFAPPMHHPHQQQMMYMQQQQQMMMAMQHQSMVMRNMHMQHEMQLRQQQLLHQQRQYQEGDYFDQEQAAAAASAEVAETAEESSSLAGGGEQQAAWSESDLSKSQQSEIERALEAMQNEDGMGVERLEEIWRSFGLQQNDPLEGTALGSKAAFAEGEGPSKEGYMSAWQDIQARLETPVGEGKEYLYAQGNPYLAQEERAASEQDEKNLFDLGMELFAEGQVAKAILAFEAEVQKNVDSDEGWRMLGMCHAENDEDKRAILCLKKSVECDPYNLEALLALGTSYVNELDSVKALETLRSWVKHNPRFQGLRVQEDEYSDGTLMDEVTQLMLAVEAVAPEDVDVKVVLGVLYNVSLDYRSAVENFRLALMQRPQDYSLHNKLGATLANSNQSIEALPIYKTSIELRPKYARGWLNLGISYANINRYEESAKAYVQALHLNPAAKHIWSYLRVVFTCMDRLDLVEHCGRENITVLVEALQVGLL